MSEAVALFSTRSEAERATDGPLARGYDSERIGYLDPYRDENGEVVTNEEYFDDDAFEQSEVLNEATKGVAGGAVGGAAVGAGAGLLASAGLLLVPGIGPLLAAGTLGAAGLGAAGGGVLGGVAGAIFGAVDNDEPDDEVSGFYF